MARDIFYTHQISGACAGVCACNRTYQMEKTDVGCQFLCQSLDRGSKVLLGFLEEKLETSIYVKLGLLYAFADQMENCSIQINKVKDWTFRFQKKQMYLLNNDKQR